MADLSSEASEISKNNSNKEDPHSSYYLHPGENSGDILVSPPFEGGNYHYWNRSIRKALLSKNKCEDPTGGIGVTKAYDKGRERRKESRTFVNVQKVSRGKANKNVQKEGNKKGDELEFDCRTSSSSNHTVTSPNFTPMSLPCFTGISWTVTTGKIKNYGWHHYQLDHHRDPLHLPV
ncbi:hypothetical protein Lal_00004789 [Lupinus albus]|nr:hypothetical protein Lal_00004789 [Lupinus albus]